MPRYPGFIGPSYVSQSIVAADDQCVNWIPAKIESGTGAAPWVYDPAPGFSLKINPSDIGGTRASYTINDTCYMVQGDRLRSVVIGSSSSVTDLVVIGGSGGTAASISGNGEGGNQIMAANGAGSGDLFWYNTVTLASGAITSVNAHVLAFMNGYFIGLNTSTATIYVSALEDGTSWDPLDLAQRNDSADKWRTMIVRSTELWLFGFTTTSIYYNDPTAEFPFVPNPNIQLQRGIRAPLSLCLLQGSPIWLADDGTVRYAQGYTPVRVSNHALEYAISQMEFTGDADAFTYQEQGHSFYVLNFPDSPGATWRYDLTTDLWTQGGVYNAGTGNFDVSPAIFGLNITQHQSSNEPNIIVGSRTDSKIYLQSQTYATEFDGTTGITRRRRAPNLVAELKRVIYDRFELFMEVGTANAAPPGNTPTVLLQWSDDGGHTFNSGISVSAGLHNAWNTRVFWQKLGMARNRVFQVTVSDPIQWRLVDAFLQTRPGAS